MPSYFSKGTKSSDAVSDKYLHINNCGFCEALEHTNIARPQGRKDYQLIYIKSGQMHFHTDGQKRPIAGGHVFLYRPGTAQYYSIDGIPTTFFWIHFTGTAVTQMLSSLPDGCIQTGALPEFERYCRAFYMDSQLIHRFDPLHYEGALITLFAAIAAKVAAATPDAQNYEKLNNALVAMNSSLSPRLSNDQLSELCGLDKRYFIKLFKRTTGTTPQQYYTVQIIDKARSLLEYTDYSVSQVAVLCGIEDSFYFSRLFKKHMGISPSDYRKI